MENDFDPEDKTNLTAYRLGRLEKSVEHFDVNARNRDDKIIEKLELLSHLSEKVAKHTWQIAGLEKSRDRLIAAVSAVGTGVVMIIVNAIFKVV